MFPSRDQDGIFGLYDYEVIHAYGGHELLGRIDVIAGGIPNIGVSAFYDVASVCVAQAGKMMTIDCDSRQSNQLIPLELGRWSLGGA